MIGSIIIALTVSRIYICDCIEVGLVGSETSVTNGNITVLFVALCCGYASFLVTVLLETIPVFNITATEQKQNFKIAMDWRETLKCRACLEDDSPLLPLFDIYEHELTLADILQSCINREVENCTLYVAFVFIFLKIISCR